MDKNIIIQNLNNNILYQLKPSRIDGIGIHSITDIKENTVIIRNITPIPGSHCTEKEIKKLNPEIKKICAKYFHPKEGEKIFIPHDPSILSTYYLPNYFLNHSKNPNVKSENGNIVSIKNIKKNEEITIDYQKYLPYLFKDIKTQKKTKKKQKKK
jgi:hypothetical protein